MAESYDQVTYEGKTEFMDYNVLEAAYARMELLVRMYDHITVWYSGGKDSQLTLELLRRVYDKMGLQDRKVHFTFMDMEFIEDEVIKSAEKYFADPRYEGVWLAAPQIDHMVVMGERQDVLLWDPSRKDEWGRIPPDGATYEVPGFGDTPITRQTERRAIAACFPRPGSLCIINSHRFSENEVIRMVIMKGEPNTCWIHKNPEGLRGVDMVRPIYDWSMRDVFRFFYEEGVDYPLAYDINLHSGNALRAGTPPLDLVSSGKLESLRQSYPKLFIQITTMWPEMLTQERYAHDVDPMTVIDRYEPGWGGIAKYISENITDPERRKQAMKAVGAAKTTRESQRLRGKSGAPCYNMPILWVWTQIIRGDFRRGIPKKPHPTKAMIEFEARVSAPKGVPSE